MRRWKFNLRSILQQNILHATIICSANADIFSSVVFLSVGGPLWSFVGKVNLLPYNFSHLLFRNFDNFLLQQIILTQFAHNNTLINLHRLRLVNDYLPEAGTRSQIELFYLTQSNVKILQGKQEFNLQLFE